MNSKKIRRYQQYKFLDFKWLNQVFYSAPLLRESSRGVVKHRKRRKQVVEKRGKLVVLCFVNLKMDV